MHEHAPAGEPPAPRLCRILLFGTQAAALPLTIGTPAGSISRYFASEVFTGHRHFQLGSPPAPPIHEDSTMSFRRDYITKPIFSWARGVLPSMSDTEREALEAGDV